MSEPSGVPASSRYVVGIDLGTTNSALAFVDTDGEGDGLARPVIHTFAVPQLTSPGTVEARTLLPSFLHVPRSFDAAAGSLRLPWGEAEHVIGSLAARRAAEQPERTISSAKSWLCHPGVDRMAAILPWIGVETRADEGGEETPRRSPVDAAAAYLTHLRDAWNHEREAEGPASRLEHQDVYLTVPASFDAPARELTRLAAARAGLERLHLLEEPQAALYAWVEVHHESWRDQVRAGDALLVFDVGGGTTDLSLVLVVDEAGELVLRRIAVGDHLLLGGDNMDLALAMQARDRLARAGTRLDGWQFRALVPACRAAKEALLAGSGEASAAVVIPGRGKKLVGGTVRTELTRAEVQDLLVDGFFPSVERDDHVRAGDAAGLSEIGLPFASDAAITRHLASFLAAHAGALIEASQGAVSSGLPTALLFNGGVMQADVLRARVEEVLGHWARASKAEPPRSLAGFDLEHAVARGAAYYGLARRGRGIRIRGGTARSYYVGVASAMPAVPGQPPPVKALCVVPFGIEEGSRLDVPGTEFGLLVGGTARFRFFASSVRRDDVIGTVLDEWETSDLEELAPLSVALEGGDAGARVDGSARSGGDRVPVRLAAHVTEIGTLELWFAPPGERDRWRLEFTVREVGARR